MNLYLRFVLILIKAWFAKKQAILAESVLNFRVLPFDCDINFHLNNARYLSFMDLGRIRLMGQGKLLAQIYKERWLPVVTAIEISFIRALSPWQRFQLVSRVVGWDENYIYIEQRFETVKGLAAIALVKGTFVINGKKCRMQEIMDTVEPGVQSPPLPNIITQWKDFTDAKKSFTQTVGSNE